MNLRSVFFNDYGRLRSGVRMMIFLLSFLIGSSFLLTAGLIILWALPFGLSQSGLGSLLLQYSVPCAVAIFFGWLYGRFFEDLPFRALGCWLTKRWFLNLVVGFLMGALSLGLAVLIAWAGGGLTIKYNDSDNSLPILMTLGSTFLIFVAGAAFEELLFRGYPLQTLSRARLALFGTVLTSLIFATMHNGNPGANPLSWANTFLAGVWLAIAYFKTRDLWFPFGIHFAWNWFQGSIFGINVSGLDKLAPAPIMRSIDKGPAWLTGSDYGLEGGLACTIALLVTIALIYFMPLLKPDPEMLALTSEEQSRESRVESRESGV
ncbi:MAG: CPBP family intramembrane metalloprotease [Acidobacteria bacterium]|nr:CPBP family intramembrane metalloprotease [Acidobacteriota bacterium]